MADDNTGDDIEVVEPPSKRTRTDPPPPPWARPPLPANYSDGPLVFQHTEIDYVTSYPVPGMPGSPVAPVPVVRVFGVTENSNSVLMLVHGFEPYLYVRAPEGFEECHCKNFRWELDQYLRTHIKQGECVLSEEKDYINDVELVKKQSLIGYHGGQLDDFIKITMAIPKHVPIARKVLDTGKIWNGTKMPTFESDIVFVLRFMVDLKLVGCSWIKVEHGKYNLAHKLKHVSTCQIEAVVAYTDVISLGVDGEWAKIAPMRILSFDIECAARAGHFPHPTMDPVIQISNQITVQGESKPMAKTMLALRETSKVADDVTLICHEDESALLLSWARFVRESDPDIIIGYNIMEFDLWYLRERAEHIGVPIANRWTRIENTLVKCWEKTFQSKAFGKTVNKEYSTDGRVPFDILQVNFPLF